MLIWLFVFFTQYTEHVKFTGCSIVKGDQKAKPKEENNCYGIVAIFFFFIRNNSYVPNFRCPLEIKFVPAKKLVSDQKLGSFASSAYKICFCGEI